MDIHLVELDVRKGKPGRYLTVFDFAAVSELLGAPVTCCYVNTMGPGVVAGNHWHREKRELFACVRGVISVHFAHPETGDRAEHTLVASDKGQGIVVPSGIAHAVKNCGETFADLLVFATGEPRGGDDVDFVVI